MEFIYVLVSDGCEWEDMIVFLSEENAVKMSIKYPSCRVEVFGKKDIDSGYTSTYNYYQNGKLFQSCDYIENTKKT
jgi:hypothetical protein